MPPQFDAIDNLNSRLPGSVKWGLTGLGGAAGFAYAHQHGSTQAASCVVAGAAVGFCLVVLLVGGLKLMKQVAALLALLLFSNYVVLIPFGFGNYMPVAIHMAQRVGAFLLAWSGRLVDQWLRGLR